ncbi:MAG: hypothetical protein V4690_01075 [Patescibacteria group bacterium]
MAAEFWLELIECSNVLGKRMSEVRSYPSNVAAAVKIAEKLDLGARLTAKEYKKFLEEKGQCTKGYFIARKMLVFPNGRGRREGRSYRLELNWPDGQRPKLKKRS